MAEALTRTHDAMGEPRWVVALGDCAGGRCPFRGTYAAGEGVESVLRVDVHVAGCPPSPADIILRLRSLMRDGV
jgi:NADH:ubiquinone oxidoreductase subunit B-like Fe-S oxidoreductase